MGGDWIFAHASSDGRQGTPAVRQASGMVAGVASRHHQGGVVMNLFTKLHERAASGRPLRVGLIGAGKFGSMYLAQVPKIPGVHLAAIADLSVTDARANLERVGWDPARSAAASIDEAVKLGTTHVGQDWEALIAHPAIDIVAECTGNPI